MSCVSSQYSQRTLSLLERKYAGGIDVPRSFILDVIEGGNHEIVV